MIDRPGTTPVDRDTEEWLRPWRVPDDAAAPVAATAPSGPAGTAGSPGRRFEPTSVASVRVTRPGATADAAAPRDPAAIASPPASRPPQPGGDGGGRAGGAGPGAGRPGPRPQGRLRIAIVGLLAGIVGAAIGTSMTLSVVGEDDAEVVDRASEPTSDETGAVATGAGSRTEVVEGPDGARDTVVSTVAEAVLPAVVRIDVFVSEDDAELGVVDVAAGVGSGVVFTSDGYVLTNNHVVEDADSVVVQLADGSEEEAEVIGTDRITDLAVLRIGVDDLTAVTLRTDDPLRVGETAVAIGSPFGLDASVTAGVVSAINRDLQVPGEDGEGSFVIPATIQTDAAINPGNSGGALVDATGRLIGINTAIYTGSGGSQGVGFAIPTRTVVAAAEQLIERGFVSHPFLGISGLDVTTELARRYEEDHDIDLEGGAVVDEVVPGSAAAAAGLRSGDVIVEFGGETVTGMTDVIAAISAFDIGDEVTVEVLRDGQQVTLTVTLGERPREGS